MVVGFFHGSVGDPTIVINPISKLSLGIDHPLCSGNQLVVTGQDLVDPSPQSLVIGDNFGRERGEDGEVAGHRPYYDGNAERFGKMTRSFFHRQPLFSLALKSFSVILLPMTGRHTAVSSKADVYPWKRPKAGALAQ